MNQQVFSQRIVVASQTAQEVAPPTQPVSTPPVQASATSVLWLLLLTSGILLTIPCIFTLDEVREQWRKWSTNRQAKSAVPCKMCHYFINNSYLNCAVHPHRALKVEAADCSDFCPKVTPKRVSPDQYQKE